MTHRAWAWAGVGMLAGAGALWWWLADSSPVQAPPGTMPATLPRAAGSGPVAATVGAGESSPQALLTPGLRDALEALLHAAGPANDPQALKAKLGALVAQHFPPALAHSALALARRYVDYRVALGQLKPPSDPLDPDALRAAMAQLRTLQLQHFSAEEYDALFGTQLQLDQYTLARMDIERQPHLSTAQRQQALAEAEALLPPAARADRAAAIAHMDAARQTAAFDAQGIDDATRLAQRSALYGTEAAERMARLDHEERGWHARLEQYRQAQAQGLDDGGLQQLRGKLFTPQEQLRIDAALALRAQQGEPAR